MGFTLTEIRHDGTYADIATNLAQFEAKEKFDDYLSFVATMPVDQQPKRVMVLNQRGIAVAYKFFDTP